MASGDSASKLRRRFLAYQFASLKLTDLTEGYQTLFFSNFLIFEFFCGLEDSDFGNFLVYSALSESFVEREWLRVRL